MLLPGLGGLGLTGQSSTVPFDAPEHSPIQ